MAEDFSTPPSKTGTKLEMCGVGQTFFSPAGVTVTALVPLDLEIPEGKFVSIIGPSGCGKSTLFNIIAGLLSPTTGTVRLAGQDVTRMIGLVGYMLQKDLLLPWRTILDNVILGMELKGVPRAEARARALPYLHRYGLGGFENQHPSALSGGMRQRAALLRTLLYDTEVVLLDEPFGALDAQTRSLMQSWLLQLWSDFQKTVVFVTHDVEEAVFLSDVVHVMTARPGRIKASLAVPLPRPRERHVVADPRFVQIKATCLDLLMAEVHAEPVPAAQLA
jgi:ABC-type nitrate/sulfonate/bicarbonate transport system ATPase subunit